MHMEKTMLDLGSTSVRCSSSSGQAWVRLKQLQVGVALVKPTARYFWFPVTFHHNWICGHAAAFKNYFLGCLPTLLKKISKTGPNANNVIRPPPIPPPWCNDSPCINSLVTNQGMHSHGGNTSACDCIT